MKMPRLALLAPLGTILALLAVAPGCGFWGSAVEEEDFESEPADYSKNAKEYFNAGRYARSRDQWEKYLKKRPDDWMGRLGLAYCDVFLGIRQLAAANIEGGRKRLTEAEAVCRQLWNGELADSTEDTRLEPEQPWKAAFGIAMALRGQGWADRLAAQQLTRRVQRMELDDPERPELVEQVSFLKQRRQGNYEAATRLFERLAAMEYASPDAIKQVAEMYVILGRGEDAEKQFLRYLALADMTYEQHQDTKEKLDDVYKNQESLDVANNFIEEKLSSNTEKRVEVLVGLGQLTFERGEYARSIRYLNRAQELQPERLDLLLKLAQCYGEQKSYDQAIRLLDQYIRKSSEEERGWNANLVMAYRLKSEFARKLDQGRR